MLRVAIGLIFVAAALLIYLFIDRSKDAQVERAKALEKYKRLINNKVIYPFNEVENTAVAAKRVVEEGDKSQAAIASEIAGQLYGLELLKPSIQNNQGNTTRFVILANRKVYQKDAGKISICFELPHTSGSLYNMLGNFIFNHVNMMMIESRPIPGRNWEYRFFVDIEGNLQDAGVKNALRGIGAEAQNFKILGNY